MGSLEELLNHKKSVQENISKSFGSGFDLNEEWIQKARSGVYADTAENRKLNRVGQQYGSKKQEEQPNGKTSAKQEEGGADVSSQAAKASDGALKRAAADEKAPEHVRNAAKEELKKRGKSDDSGSGKQEEKKEEKDLAEIPVNGRIKIDGVGYFKKVGKSDWVKFDPNTGKESDKRINYTKISDNGYAKGVTIVDSSGKSKDNNEKDSGKTNNSEKKAEDNKKDETKLSKREISKLERQMNNFKYMRIEGSTVFGGNALPYDFSFGNISGNTLTIFANGKADGDSKSYTEEFEYDKGVERTVWFSGIPAVFYYAEPLQQLSNSLIAELKDKGVMKVKMNFNLD